MPKFEYPKEETKNWEGVPVELVEKMWTKYKTKQITSRQLLSALGCRSLKQISAFLWRKRGRGIDYNNPGLVEGQTLIPLAVIERK